VRKRNPSGPSALAARIAAHMTRCWALELAGQGIRVNAIAAGPTETDFLTERVGLSSEQAESIKAQERSRIPLGRRGLPANVGRNREGPLTDFGSGCEEKNVKSSFNIRSNSRYAPVRGSLRSRAQKSFHKKNPGYVPVFFLFISRDLYFTASPH
jgi:hypothetical protein